jgi:CRP-like cAMP-binding protein
MLDRQPRSASARALTAITAAKVSPEAYERLLDELPEWAVSVMRALVERLRYTNDVVREIQKAPAGTVNPAAQQALEYAEFSDSESRILRIQSAEGDFEHTDSNFDFSIYDSSGPKREQRGPVVGGAASSSSSKPTGKS